jgi:cytochrome c
MPDRRPGEKSDDLTVKLCDNETTCQVSGSQAKTRADGEAISATLMAQWLAKHPDATWETEIRSQRKIVAPADNSDLVTQGKDQGHEYGRITPRDVLIWQRDVGQVVAAGARVFHSADELGSTIAVSCDMCHPDAANTHPETYPKFQVQLGRTALLRDMINWCLEHPVRAERMADDDPRMRALEAYIIGQRKGTPLNYGRR